MTYNEKRSLYETIMRDISGIVRRHLNESESNDFDKWKAKAPKDIIVKDEKIGFKVHFVFDSGADFYYELLRPSCKEALELLIIIQNALLKKNKIYTRASVYIMNMKRELFNSLSADDKKKLEDKATNLAKSMGIIKSSKKLTDILNKICNYQKP